MRSVVLLADGTLLIITADKLPRVNKRRNKCFVSRMVSERRSPRQNVTLAKPVFPVRAGKARPRHQFYDKGKIKGGGGGRCLQERLRGTWTLHSFWPPSHGDNRLAFWSPATEFWSHYSHRLFLHLSASQDHVMGGSIFKTKSKSTDFPIQTVSNGVAPALCHFCSSPATRGARASQ